eukprot:7148704-Alexandrium_andersonii.AAC.1
MTRFRLDPHLSSQRATARNGGHARKEQRTAPPAQGAGGAFRVVRGAVAPPGEEAQVSARSGLKALKAV